MPGLDSTSSDEILKFVHGKEPGRCTDHPIRVVRNLLAPGSSQEFNSPLSSLPDFLDEKPISVDKLVPYYNPEAEAKEPGARYLADYGVPLTATCRVLGLSAQGFYT
ncbi:hypothetical protein ACWGK5_30605 [Rhodococcus qingshengii]